MVARADAVNRLCLDSATGFGGGFVGRAQPEVDDAAVRLMAEGDETSDVTNKRAAN